MNVALSTNSTSKCGSGQACEDSGPFRVSEVRFGYRKTQCSGIISATLPEHYESAKRLRISPLPLGNSRSGQHD